MERGFQLHVVTDGQKDTEELLATVEQIVARGVDAVQLRYKSAPALDLYRLAVRIKELLAGTSTRLLINDRVDVALAVGADGVHLAGKSLPVDRVRQLVPRHFLVGRSVHSTEEAVAAERDGAHYITYGHVFATSSKPGMPPRGVEALREVVESVSIPVLAIGGITPENAGKVAESGCSGIAVIGAVMGHREPALAVRALRASLEASGRCPKVPFFWPEDGWMTKGES